MIYETILERMPLVAFEIGTWEGGGSTLFIAQALHDAGVGVLHTIERDPRLYELATAGLTKHMPHLKPFICFHLGNSLDVCPALLSSFGSVDSLFLDGAQDPNQTIAEFEMFKPYLRKNSVLMMHDWDNEKMAKLRKLIETSYEWRTTRVLTRPHSVGLAVAIKSGD